MQRRSTSLPRKDFDEPARSGEVIKVEERPGRVPVGTFPSRPAAGAARCTFIGGSRGAVACMGLSAALSCFVVGMSVATPTVGSLYDSLRTPTWTRGGEP